MKRKLLIFISWLSLALCVGAVVLSEWNSAHTSFYGSGLRFSHGYFSLAHSRDGWEIEYLPPHGSYFYFRFPLWPIILVTATLPIFIMSRLRGVSTAKVLWSFSLIFIPSGWLFGSAALAEHWANGNLGWWAILVAAISLTAFAATANRLANRATKLQRQQRNECVSCGYSLTGNTSGTCPECGTPIK